MTREKAIEKLWELFDKNDDLFNETIEELDSYNGYLGDDRYYSMDELDEFYNRTEPSEILMRAFYGYDEEYYDTEKGYTESFNPNREYFRFNGYGNLVSADNKDYSAHYDNYFIEALIDNASSLYLDDEIQTIIDDIDEE